MTATRLITKALCSVIVVLTLRAQYTIEFAQPVSGGVTSARAGSFTIRGTIGQPEASPCCDDVLQGGFWPALNDEPAAAFQLEISQNAAGISIKWPIGLAGLVLESASDIAATKWVPIKVPPNTNSVVLAPTAQGAFCAWTRVVEGYRLNSFPTR